MILIGQTHVCVYITEFPVIPLTLLSSVSFNFISDFLIIGKKILATAVKCQLVTMYLPSRPRDPEPLNMP